MDKKLFDEAYKIKRQIENYDAFLQKITEEQWPSIIQLAVDSEIPGLREIVHKCICDINSRLLELKDSALIQFKQHLKL